MNAANEVFTVVIMMDVWSKLRCSLIGRLQQLILHAALFCIEEG